MIWVCRPDEQRALLHHSGFKFRVHCRKNNRSTRMMRPRHTGLFMAWIRTAAGKGLMPQAKHRPMPASLTQAVLACTQSPHWILSCQCCKLQHCRNVDVARPAASMCRTQAPRHAPAPKNVQGNDSTLHSSSHRSGGACIEPAPVFSPPARLTGSDRNQHT